MTWKRFNPTGWTECRCFKKLFSFPSLFSTPSATDPSLHALLEQPDWTDNLTNEQVWSTAFKKSSWNLPGNCFFIAKGQEKRSLVQKSFSALLLLLPLLPPSRFCSQIQMIPRNKWLLPFFFFFNYSEIVLCGQFLRALGTNVKCTTEPTISSHWTEKK